MIAFEAKQLSDLDEIAARLLNLAGNRRLFALYGAMGAGKTTLIKVLCHQLGVTDEVNSPTFSIVNEYLTLSGDSVFHFDFYRINKIEEAYDIGYENYFFGGSHCFVEWPEKIRQLLPADCVQLWIAVDEQTGVRTINSNLTDSAKP